MSQIAEARGGGEEVLSLSLRALLMFNATNASSCLCLLLFFRVCVGVDKNKMKNEK
jgi:hypothetical protein